MTGRPGWDEYFLGIAEAVSRRADCTRRQVGAVIVDADHRIVSTGYNGAAAGKRGCLSGACPRGRLSYDELPHQAGGYDNCISLHAELNACVYAGRSPACGLSHRHSRSCPSCDSSHSMSKNLLTARACQA
jgi:dCMP deaminase